MIATCDDKNNEDVLLTSSQAQLLAELEVAATCGLGAITDTSRDDKTYDFDILDFDACYARWGDALTADGRIDHTVCGDDGITTRRAHWAWLERLQELCTTSCAEFDKLLVQLHELEGERLEVSRRTAMLREKALAKLRDRERLDTFAEALAQRLEAFGHASDIARALEQPEGVLASPDDFGVALDKLEQAAAYMEMRQDFSGASDSLRDLDHLRSRACLLARAGVQRRIERATGQVDWLLEEAEGQSVDTHTVFHAPFQALAPECRPVTILLYQRVDIHQVYLAALEELESMYAAARGRLIAGAVASSLGALVREQTELASAVRQACAFVIEADRIERDLFSAFFEARQPQNALEGLLELLGAALSKELHAAVRACISLDALREAAECLQVEFLELHQQAAHSSGCTAATLGAMRRLQAELQERLVFHAQAQIRSRIVNYNAIGSDLDYPDVLCEHRPILGTSSSGSRVTSSRYPTLDCTLETLAKTFRVLEPHKFSGLAQESVNACMASLGRAAAILAERALANGNDEKQSLPEHRPYGLSILVRSLETQLFQLRHLLILREQMASFNYDFPDGGALVDAARLRRSQADMNSGIEAAMAQVCDLLVTEIIAWASRGGFMLLVSELASGAQISDQRRVHAGEAFLARLRIGVPLAVAYLRVYLAPPGGSGGSGGGTGGPNGSSEMKDSTVVLFAVLQERILECWLLLQRGVAQSNVALAGLPDTVELKRQLTDMLDIGQKANWADVVKVVMQAPRPHPAKLAPAPVAAASLYDAVVAAASMAQTEPSLDPAPPDTSNGHPAVAVAA